ncbi:MAG: HAD-IA family hydrolase [Steroidobacteraceae bacterium]
MLKAILWDVDGTLAETERDGHRIAFNQAFEALGVPWRWDEQHYGELLRVTGGRERLLHDMQRQPLAPREAAEREALASRLHALKNELYARIVATGALPLRPGVVELMDDCAREGLSMGVVTTTSRINVGALLAPHLGSAWESAFAVIVTAQEAPSKKPDPQAYNLALEQLELPPSSALAIEDSPAGVAAARAAGVPVLVTRSVYFASQPVPGALAVGASLGSRAGWQPPIAGAAGVPDRVDLTQIRQWHARAAAQDLRIS